MGAPVRRGGRCAVPGLHVRSRRRGRRPLPRRDRLPGRARPTGRHLCSRLYSPAELYGTADYQHSVDAQAYAWSRQPADPDATLAAALHDHAIDDALGDWVASRRLVGVMGGHAARRGTGEYAEAARLGRALAAGHVVATGGGPGTMEAANLGAWMSVHDTAALVSAS